MFAHYIMKSLGHAKSEVLSECLSGIEERWKMSHAFFMPSDFCVCAQEPVAGSNSKSNCGTDAAGRGALECKISGTVLELHDLFAHLSDDNVEQAQQEFINHQATQEDTHLRCLLSSSMKPRLRPPGMTQRNREKKLQSPGTTQTTRQKKLQYPVMRHRTKMILCCSVHSDADTNTGDHRQNILVKEQ